MSQSIHNGKRPFCVNISSFYIATRRKHLNLLITGCISKCTCWDIECISNHVLMTGYITHSGMKRQDTITQHWDGRPVHEQSGVYLPAWMITLTSILLTTQIKAGLEHWWETHSLSKIKYLYMDFSKIICNELIKSKYRIGLVIYTAPSYSI